MARFATCFPEGKIWIWFNFAALNYKKQNLLIFLKFVHHSSLFSLPLSIIFCSLPALFSLSILFHSLPEALLPLPILFRSLREALPPLSILFRSLPARQRLFSLSQFFSILCLNSSTFSIESFPSLYFSSSSLPISSPFLLSSPLHFSLLLVDFDQNRLIVDVVGQLHNHPKLACSNRQKSTCRWSALIWVQNQCQWYQMTLRGGFNTDLNEGEFPSLGNIVFFQYWSLLATFSIIGYQKEYVRCFLFNSFESFLHHFVCCNINLI